MRGICTKKFDLFPKKQPRKSSFLLNVADISNYRVTSILKIGIVSAIITSIKFISPIKLFKNTIGFMTVPRF